MPRTSCFADAKPSLLLKATIVARPIEAVLTAQASKQGALLTPVVSSREHPDGDGGRRWTRTRPGTHPQAQLLPRGNS
jgi:hypothetical protein